MKGAAWQIAEFGCGEGSEGVSGRVPKRWIVGEPQIQNCKDCFKHTHCAQLTRYLICDWTIVGAVLLLTASAMLEMANKPLLWL